jgi:predicted GNAT family acetyltransferase
MKSAYYITIETLREETVPYETLAGDLVAALHATLTDGAKYARIMKARSEVTDAWVEVEVTEQDEKCVLAHTLLAGEADEKMTFDKTLFTKLVRAELQGKYSIKVTKRAVEKEELLSVVVD